MTPGSGLPPGYTTVHAPGGTLMAEAALLPGLTRAGLDKPGGWQRLLTSEAAGSGRGATGRLALDDTTLVLKQMRRGGWLGPLWRDRYPGRGRLLSNLTVPVSVARRGIATAVPSALLLVPGPSGLYRGWLATRLIPRVENLRDRFRESPPTVAELEAVLALVRAMHDAGVDHPDLNLGNLLVRPGDPGPEAFVVDLDRVELTAPPLEFARRQQALRRLERSFVKNFGEHAVAPDWYGLYSAGDPELERRLRRGQPAGRWLRRLHRLGWRS